VCSKAVSMNNIKRHLIKASVPEVKKLSVEKPPVKFRSPPLS